MKNVKVAFVALVMLLGATSFMNAQSKIAHIDTQALVEAMPEMKTAQNNVVPWLASQTDILADDWQVVAS